ncbi:MAG: phage holin family protein [Psychroflexus sp.]
MKTLLQIILTGIIVLMLSNILPGVYVSDLFTAIVVAAVLSLLNIFIKPILVIFTLPVTILTFGLFYNLLFLRLPKNGDSILKSMQFLNRIHAN